MSTTIAPLVPNCSQDIDTASINASAAFNPVESTYYTDLWRVWVPGAVLGGVALLSGVLFLIWLFTLCCRKHTWRHQLEWLENSPSCASKEVRDKVRGRRWLLVLIFIFAVGSVGLCIWGLVEAILETNNKVGEGWELFDRAEQQVAALVRTADVSTTGVETILAVTNSLLDPPRAPAPGTLPILSPGPASAPQGSNSSGSGITDATVLLRAASASSGAAPVNISAAAINLARQLQNELPPLINASRSAIQLAQDDILNEMKEIRHDWQPMTQNVDETWRYVLFAVFFGILIFLIICATAALVSNRAPRFGAACTFLLWVMTAVLALAGAGLFAGMYQVSGDACVSLEQFIYDKLQTANDPQFRERAAVGMKYYTNNIDLPDSEVLWQVYGVNNTGYARSIIMSTPITTWIRSDAGQAAINSMHYTEDQRKVILALPATANATASSVNEFTRLVNRSQWTSLYEDLKTMICCSLRGSAYNLWVAWTAASCCCIVLAALLTWQTMSLVVWNV